MGSLPEIFFHCISGVEYPEGEVEPPPPISLEELQGEVRTVANRVLSRPQSGMVFMEDVKTAIAMWADRLSYLLGPPKSGMPITGLPTSVLWTMLNRNL